MEELNTLISPCKKLRLESSDTADKVDINPDGDNHVDAVSREMEGVVDKVVNNGDTASVSNVQCDNQPDTENSAIQNGISDSSHNTGQNGTQIYSSNATAMLVTMNDRVVQDDNTDLAVVKCSAELVHELNDFPLVQDSCITTNECASMQADLQKTSKVLNEYEQELQGLMRERRNEVKQLCSGVKVSAIIKKMESGQSVKTDVEDMKCASPVLVATELDTDSENLGCVETDEINCSDRTIIDTSEECCTERLEVSGASECDNDIVVDKTDHSQNNEHVYANVIVNSPDSNVKLTNQIENRFYNDVKVNSNCNALMCNDEEQRTSGDGAEVLEDTKRYFSVVDDDSDSDIGGDGIEVEEETNNYFCTFQENHNTINSHYLYDIKEERDCDDLNVNSTIITAQRLNNTEVEITRTISHGQADPLCSSTPRPTKLDIDFTENKCCNESSQVLALNSLNPSVDNKPVVPASNSQPLLTSTPLLKPYQGLKMRDMNIMHGDVKCNIESKLKLYELDQKREENIAIYADTANKNDDIEIKKEVVRRHSFSGESVKRYRKSKHEKKKDKGVRKEKFKEYMGPGLTVGISTEDGLEANGSETCTLIEYKGFGLTGPLPDKPLCSSTPMPPAVESEKKLGGSERNNALGSNLDDEKDNFKRCISGVSLGERPAGTEGMLIQSFKPEIPKLRQTVSETRFGQKMMYGPTDLRKKTLSRHNSDLGPQSHSKHNRLTGWLASVQAHRPQGLLQPLAECPIPSANIPLKPDEVYPGVVGGSSIGGSSKTEKSESNSNTDKSDKSDKVQFIDPAVLQSQGRYTHAW